MGKSTIQLNKSTIERLKENKNYSRESYDELINSILDERDDEVLTPEEIDDLKEALEEVKRGETVPIEEVAKDLGIKL